MPKPSPWKNRIVGHGEETPDQLLASPWNWRIHAKTQQDALGGVLDELGWIQSVIVSQRSGHVVDGHLRVALAISRNEPSVPVVYVDLDEAEEKYALSVIDPISALAATDREKLAELLDEVSTGDAAVQALLSDLAESAGIVSADWAGAFEGLPDGDREPFQQMTFTLTDEQAEGVKAAIALAKARGGFDGTGNENSNGNALARICEAYGG